MLASIRLPLVAVHAKDGICVLLSHKERAATPEPFRDILLVHGAVIRLMLDLPEVSPEAYKRLSREDRDDLAARKPLMTRTSWRRGMTF